MDRVRLGPTRKSGTASPLTLKEAQFLPSPNSLLNTAMLCNEVLVMDSGCSTVKSSEIVVVDDSAARVDGMAIVDGRAVSDVAVKGSGTAVANDATIKADALQVLVMDSGCSTVKSSEIVVVDDSAARVDGMAIVDGRAVSDVAVKGSGTAVADDATIKADALQLRNHPVQARNLLKSFQVRIFKLRMILRLSGTTSLVNDSNMDIEFANETTAMNLSRPRFCLKAYHTEYVNMRKFFAFRGARVAEVVTLKVGGDQRKTFIPEDFVTYKKFVFKDNKGELTCELKLR